MYSFTCILLYLVADLGKSQARDLNGVRLEGRHQVVWLFNYIDYRASEMDKQQAYTAKSMSQTGLPKVCFFLRYVKFS